MDVVASSGWLHPALAAMEMCQMVIQGQWEKDSPLLQLPHITPQVAAAAAAKDISTVFDLIEMDEEERRELLQVRLAVHKGQVMSLHGRAQFVHDCVLRSLLACSQLALPHAAGSFLETVHTAAMNPACGCSRVA